MRRLFKWLIGYWKRSRWWGKSLVVVIGLIGIFLCGFIALTIYSQFQSNSVTYIRRWFNDESSRDELITIQRERCEGAPFLLPSDGFIGLLWRDPAGPYNILRRHSGIDIFGDGESGDVPVYAAYEGYLTRLDDWVSAVISQHDDPLEPGRAIWTYYAHMASADGDSYIVDEFPAGTRGKWVERGQLIGYQGEYNGSGIRPIGLHLHLSIVLSEDDGSFKNETDSSNTLDPSPYFGMPMNIDQLPSRPIQCNS